MARTALVVATALLAAAAAGCSRGPADGPLRGLHSEVTGVIPGTERYDTLMSGAWDVCLTGAGPVTLDGVEPRLGGGAQLLDVRAAPTSAGRDGIGILPGPVPQLYRPLADVTVDLPCTDDGERIEIVLLLRPAKERPSGFDGFDLLYSASGRQYRLPFAASVAFCPTGRTAAPGADSGPDRTVRQLCLDAGYR